MHLYKKLHNPSPVTHLLPKHETM